MKKIMRVIFKDGRPEEKYAIAAFRDSKRGCRVQAEDGRDLGYFGSDKCQSIVVEIHFGDEPYAVQKNPPLRRDIPDTRAYDQVQ